MELPNHLIPWDTVKKLLRGAWDEGKEAGWDNANCATPEDYKHNPYGEDE